MQANLPLVFRTSLNFHYKACALSKSKKLSFSSSSSCRKQPLDLIHVDVWDPPILSNQGFKYYILFVDDYSRYSWVFPMKLKFEAHSKYLLFNV